MESSPIASFTTDVVGWLLDWPPPPLAVGAELVGSQHLSYEMVLFLLVLD